MAAAGPLRRYLRLALEWLIVFAGLAANYGLAAVALILVARQVAPGEYAAYLSVFGLFSLSIILPGLGLDSWMLAQGGRSSAALAAVGRSAFHLRLRLILAWLAVAALVSLALPRPAFPLTLILLTLPGLAADSLLLLLYAAWRVQGAQRRVSALQISLSLALIVWAVLLTALGSRPPVFADAIAWFAGGRSVISLAGLLAAGWFSRPVLQPAISPDNTPAWPQLRPFWVADLAVSIYAKVDLALVSLFLGNPGASIYGPALNLVNLSFIAPNALYFLALPGLARAYTHDRPAFHRQVRRQLAAQALLGAFSAALVALLAPWLLELIFGPAYRPSAEALRWLSPILFLKALNFAGGAALTAAGQQAARTRVQALAAAVNLGGNLLAIPLLGVNGAIMVYLLSEGLLCAGYLLYRPSQPAS